MKDEKDMQKTINRVKRMEACFDLLRRTAEKGEALPEEELQLLIRYYESGQWLKDYELDEQGLLPRQLKRGVLAQDAVYDFLERMEYAK